MKKLFVLLVACAAVTAFADKVTLKSGSFLTGEAGIVKGDKLQFKSDDLGDLEIALANIKSLESAKSHVIQYADDSRADKVLAVRDGELCDDKGKLDMENVKAIDPEIEAWHGSVNLSASAARGNTVSESVAFFGDIARRWEHDRLTANGGYYFAQSGDSKQTKQKTAQRIELAAQEDHFWSARFYSYVNGKYEYDKIMDLDYRYRAGLGLGYQWLENAQYAIGTVSFNQEVGVAYVKEKYCGDGFTDDYETFRYAHHFAWNPGWIDNFDIVHNFELLPDMGDWCGNYIVDADAGFTYAFLPSWQLVGKVEWDYKKKVGEDTKHSDLRYLLGLGYKW